MIPLKELRKITMKPGRKPFLYWLIYRRAGLYLAWLFLHTSLTANQVTFISIFVGLTAAALFATGNYVYGIIATLIYHFYYVLDSVDGQMARYTGSYKNPVGLYYDRIGSYFIDSMIYLGIGIGAYQRFDDVFYLFLSFSMIISWLFFKISIGDKYRVYFERGIYKKKKKKGEAEGMLEEGKGILIYLKKIFDIVGFLTRNPTVFNVITICAFLNVTHLSLYYGFVFPFVTIGNFIYESRIRFKYGI